MYLEKKQDLAMYYWISNLFSDITSLTVQDEFPMEALSLPTISIEREDITTFQIELGNNIGAKTGFWSINIFAKNKSQRDGMGYRLLNNIEEGVEVNDYDEGFPPEVSPTKIGVLLPYNIKLHLVKVFPDVNDMLYWRAQLTFTTEYESC